MNWATTIMTKVLDYARGNIFFLSSRVYTKRSLFGDCRAHPAHKQDSLAMTTELFYDDHPLIFITHYHMVDTGA